MQGKKKTSIGPLIFRIALIVLCMTAFTTSMLSGLYARYTAKNNGEDSARVAKFDVTADWEDVTVVASSMQTNGTYNFTVTNNSEVAITYDLVVTFENDVLKYLDVSLDGVTGAESGNTVTFSKVISLAPGAKDVERNLSFLLTSVDLFTKPATGESYEETLTFTATIRCTQID